MVLANNADEISTARASYTWIKEMASMITTCTFGNGTPVDAD
jgi:hypothetical protein